MVVALLNLASVMKFLYNFYIFHPRPSLAVCVVCIVLFYIISNRLWFVLTKHVAKLQPV